MSDLAGRAAVVTGASRGIGLAIAVELERLGARVVRAARSLSPRATATRLDVPCDVSVPAQVEALAAAATQAFGVPAIVVSSTGIFEIAPLEQTSPEQFAAQLAANLSGPFLVARAFLPLMHRNGSGRFITIGSIADHRSFPGNSAYGASKSGLRSLHEILREEYRGSGVLLTLVSPGATDTAAWDSVDPDHREGFTPRAKMLRPDDVAQAVVWVATRPNHVEVDWLRLGPA